MAKDKQPFEALSETTAKTVEQNMEKARVMGSYFDFFQNPMSSYPWCSPEITEKMKTYTEKNISAFVECTRKLTLAKSFQEFFKFRQSSCRRNWVLMPSRPGPWARRISKQRRAGLSPSVCPLE